jgi:glycine/D-amino acid oxidase-like deaminating enzyme
MKLTGGEPFWGVRNGLLGTYPCLSSDVGCDVAIIGGGITGALLGYTLVNAGVDAVLIDKRDIGSGSTCGSTGLLQYEVDVPLRQLVKQVGSQKANRSYLMCQEAVKKLLSIVRDNQIRCEIEATPSLFLARSQNEIAELQEEQRLRKRIGIEVDFWDARQIETHYPFSRPAALFSENAAQVDPHRLTQGLLTTAGKKGLRIFDRTAATHFLPNRKGMEVITDRGFKIVARRIIIAAGFESQNYLSRQFGQLQSTFAMISEPVANLHSWHRRSLIWERARLISICAPPARIALSSAAKTFQ